MDDVVLPRPTTRASPRIVATLARPSVRAALILCLAAAVFVGVPWKDQSLSSDTVVYAQIGAEIVERGDPTRLTFDGQPASKKPPLVFWLLAATYTAFGKSDATASLPSQVAGLATVWLLMFLVARHHGRRAAFWAGLSCATWAVFARTARTCRLDTTLAFFTLASIGAFLAIDRRQATPLRSLGVGGLLGLAVLAKGPPGFIPVAAIVLGGLFAGRGRLLRQVAPWALLGLFALTVPWYALQILREGSTWWSQLRDDWARTSAPIQGVLPAIRFYLNDVFVPGLPWVLPLVFGVALAVRRIRRGRRAALEESLLLAWILCFLAVLPAIRMHYSRYFAQVVPAFAWLGAVWLAPAIRRFARVPIPWLSRVRGVHKAAAVVIAAGILVGYPVYLIRATGTRENRYEDMGAAVRILQEVEPGARTLPAWTFAHEEGAAEALPWPMVAAGRFYFGTRLVPFREGDLDQPPVLYFQHTKLGPTATAEFEATHPYAVLRRTARATVYRTREPTR